MDVVRVIIAITIFSISSYLIYDLFANGFDWLVLVASIVGYISVHYIWPKNADHESDWYELLEHILDLPFRAMSSSLRLVGKLFRGGDGNLDVDL